MQYDHEQRVLLHQNFRKSSVLSSACRKQSSVQCVHGLNLAESGALAKQNARSLTQLIDAAQFGFRLYDMRHTITASEESSRCFSEFNFHERFSNLRFLQPLGKNWGRRSRGVENTQPHHLLMGLLAQVLLERFSLASTGAALAG
jgi:hypothetical protein